MADSSSESMDSPAVRLGRQLKRIRLAAGYTTLQSLAKRIGFGEDMIQKAETGKQVPSEEVFPAILDACTTSIDGETRIVTDGERAALTELWEIARDSKGLVVEDFEKWPAIEQQASFLRAWNPMLVPGLLQVEGYALPLFLSMGKTKDKATESLGRRLDRQDVLAGPDPVTGVFLLDESVLYKLVGSPATMVKQLDRILTASELPSVTIQIVPGAASLSGMFGAFEIASGRDIPDTMLIWAVRDQTTDDDALVREAIMVFELIRGRALNVEESRADVMKARQHWSSQL
jgi:transcriptional regulator with XRE-family HTH domain